MWGKLVSYALLDRCLYSLKIRDPNIDLAFIRGTFSVAAKFLKSMCFLHPPFLRHWFFVVLTINSDLQGVYNSWYLQNGTKYFADPVCISPRNIPKLSCSVGGMSWSLGDPQITPLQGLCSKDIIGFQAFLLGIPKSNKSVSKHKMSLLEVLQQHLPNL